MPEEDCQGQQEPLEDDPLHFTEGLGPNRSRIVTLGLKSEHDPDCQIEEADEDEHVSSRIGSCAHVLRCHILKGNYTYIIDFP